jgi:hypothetical protein
MAARIPMIAMTTSNSMRVNPPPASGRGEAPFMIHKSPRAGGFATKKWNEWKQFQTA